MTGWRLAWLIAFVLLACHFGSPAQAAAISVSPITLEFSQKAPVRAMEISNPGDQTVHVQLRLFSWNSDGAQPRYEPSQDIDFSPAMFELPPGGRQVIRFASRVQVPAEQAYRLFVDQIDPAPANGGLSMPVRLALPFFVEPRAPTPADVTWRLVAGEDGPRLVATNHGGRRVRIDGLSVANATRAWVLARGLAGYVLAGQTLSWPVTAMDPRPFRVKASTDQGAIDAEIAAN